MLKPEVKTIQSKASMPHLKNSQTRNEVGDIRGRYLSKVRTSILVLWWDKVQDVRQHTWQFNFPVNFFPKKLSCRLLKKATVIAIHRFDFIPSSSWLRQHMIFYRFQSSAAFAMSCCWVNLYIQYTSNPIPFSSPCHVLNFHDAILTVLLILIS